jgi:hypothetical protein
VHATPKVRISRPSAESVHLFSGPDQLPPPEFSDAASSSTSDPTTAQPSKAVISVPLTSVPARQSVGKSSPPASQSQPLQQSASNTFPIVTPLANIASEKTRASPSPLGTADSNVTPVPSVAATKAIKRGAGTNGTTTVEKRKKALKRL